MVKFQINPQVWNQNMVWNIHACIGLLNKYFQMENNQKLINWKAQIVGQWWSCTIFSSLEGLSIFNPYICLHLFLTLVSSQFVAKCLPPFINLFLNQMLDYLAWPFSIYPYVNLGQEQPLHGALEIEVHKRIFFLQNHTKYQLWLFVMTNINYKLYHCYSFITWECTFGSIW
jgi:hypothetical protein